MNWLFFALLSPAIFAISTYIDKFLLEKQNISPTVITIYGGIFAFAAGLLVLLLMGFYPIDFKSLLIILTSGFLTSIYLLPYYKALQIDETSLVVSLLYLYPVFVLFLSYVFLGESLTVRQYIGSFFVIIAGSLLSIEKTKGEKAKLKKSAWYVLISAFLFACAQVLYKFGVTEIPFWNTLPYEAFGIAIGSLVIVLYKNNREVFKKETNRFKKKVFIFIGINELVYILARYTGYYAISLITVGLVSVLASLESLFVLVYGIILSVWLPNVLKEAVIKKTLGLKFISMLMIVIGSYFIFL